MKRALLLLVTLMGVVPFSPAQIASFRGTSQRNLTAPAPLTIRSDVNEVSIAFAATDSSGRAITQLSSADVIVVDNGETIKTLRSFRPATDVPLNLVILVDASGSVASEFPRVVAELNQFFSSATLGKKDRVSMMVFGGSWPTLICASKCGNEIARLPLKSIRAGGSTPLYDALVDASKLFARQQAPESRPALVLFSDGFDTISLNGSGEALDAIRNAEAGIYTKTVGTRKKSPEGEAFLAILAQGTHGLRFPEGKSVDATLSEVVQDLRSGFVLTYELPRTGVEQHKVQVLPVRPRELNIRSRSTYQVPQDRPVQDQGTP